MAHVVPSTLLAWCPIVRLASDGKMIFKSLSVGSLYATRRIHPTTSTSGSGLESSSGAGGGTGTYRFLILSSSFQISAPVLVIILSKGKSEGSSVTMNQVPLKRYRLRRIVHPVRSNDGGAGIAYEDV